MRIGLFLAYWPWFSPEEQIELARQADREGLDSGQRESARRVVEALAAPGRGAAA